MAASKIRMENARIIWRNFSGKADKFNPKGGKRSFSVVIEDAELASQLIEDGWNVKQLKPRNEEEEENPRYSMQVKVSFDNKPPRVYLVTRNNKVLMTEDTIDSLDYAEIQNVDLVITPYTYDVNGKSGVAAYLKTMYVTVIEDEFADKYDFGDDEEVPFD